MTDFDSTFGSLDSFGSVSAGDFDDLFFDEDEELLFEDDFDDFEDEDYDEDEDEEDEEEYDLSGIASNDTVGLYLKEMARVPLLSTEEEVSLAMRLEEGRAAKKK